MAVYETSRTVLNRVSNAVAVGTTTITSASVDMQDWQGCRFIVIWGAITDGSPSMKVRQGTVTGMSDGADLAGTLAAPALTDDNKLTIVDVYRPQERFLDCVVARGGATGAVIDAIIAEQYDPRVMPATQDADVAVAEKHTSPAEGTA